MQNHMISEKEVTFGVLFCEETLHIYVLVVFCQDFDKKAERLTTY